MELKPGAKLGPYEIVSPIGAGGMGEVYKASDPRLSRTVALKVSKAEFTERFTREARTVAQLNHPNICTLHDVGPNYLVMELVEGTPLKGPLPVEKAVEYAGQILDALDAAHRKGITHRDLKPANILVTKQGIKLLDFGLAKQETGLAPDDLTIQAMTVEGQIAGTLQYMAPEQLQGKEADARSDIFSFGCVLYEMLSGVRAFKGSSAASVIAAILEREPEPLKTTPPLDRIVRTCLAKDPDQRIQTARDVKTMLLWTMENVPASSGPPKSRFGSTVWMAASAVFAISTGVALWAPWRDMKPPDQPLVRLDVNLGADVDLATAPGAGSRIIISPDGGRLVYLSQSRLYTRRLDQTSSTELKGAEGASAPFFSPDGKWVAFFEGGRLKKMSVDGGEAVAICDGGNSGSWGDDGNIIFGSAFGGGLSKVRASGGKPVPVTKLTPGEVTHRWPQVLPGSKAVLFTSHNGFGDRFDGAKIEVVSLKDGQRKTLHSGGTYGRYMPAVSGPGHLLYANHATLFAVPFDLDKVEVRGTPVPVAQDVAIGQGGAAQLDFSDGGTLVYVTGSLRELEAVQWLDSAGKAQPLPVKTGVYDGVRLSPDGQKLALTILAGSNLDIWIYEWQRDTMTRLTFGGQNGNPVWSPDGRYVVFWTSGGMFWTRADGGGKPQQLTQNSKLQLPSSFTPDGKRLLFSETTGSASENDLWTVSLESTAPDSNGATLRAGKPEVFLQTSFDESRGAFSPDGHWVAYRSNESGVYEVYVRAFPDNGGRWQISNGGGDQPRWSRSGHELIFQSGEGLMMASYAVKGDSFVPDKAQVWLPGQAGLLRDYDLTPDGKRVVALQRANAAGNQQSPSHVTFLLNFADELRRRSK